ncbi:o-succinylbenzoate--CoA ligase [Ornithinimicrobium sp. Y1847]|uniref:o-succinylbenzoate--CoA ligase n=1 Tax=unclassified Ornithinimicrobium TaxID=2615080 RepID=UPI003B6822EB
MTEHPAGAGEDLALLRRVLLEGSSESVVVATSGSSGTPKRVRLSGAALRASGEATAARLAGHGRWVLALPTEHVAGLQVLARSILAGTDPVRVNPVPGMPFTASAFTRACAHLGSGDAARAALRLTSLVPTQLHRVLADPDATRAAARLDAILLGGAAAQADLLMRASEAGLNVVTTYGMSETCGGCVYDGLPLDGVRVDLEADGRILLGGDVLADGYVDLPELSAEKFTLDEQGRRWFRTDDRGRLDGDGRLTVLGRLDDVIITGGHKVEPSDVETALRALPEIQDALVLGIEDAEWGQVVGALLVAARESNPTLDHLRAALAHTLPPHAAPRRIVWCDAIPGVGLGKPGRTRARAMLAEASGSTQS